jgi:hypothetical protein
MISVTFGRVVSIALIEFLLVCTIGVSFQTTADSEPESKFKLNDSQRVYLSGSGEKGSVGPIGPPGKVGPRGEKGSKSDSNVLAIKMLQTRLTSAERIISSLTAPPAAHLYGNGERRYRDGYMCQWLNGDSGEFLNNGMNYTNGYLTVPKPGLYYIYVQVNCDPDQNSWCGYSIRVNGNTVINNYVEHSSSAINIIHGQTSESGLLRKLNAGDRLSVTTRHIDYFGSGETSYHIGSQSFFGAVWLSSVSL